MFFMTILLNGILVQKNVGITMTVCWLHCKIFELKYIFPLNLDSCISIDVPQYTTQLHKSFFSEYRLEISTHLIS